MQHGKQYMENEEKNFGSVGGQKFHDPTYRMDAFCSNCGWYGKRSFPKGTPVNQDTAECPNCGCFRVLKFKPLERGYIETEI